MKYQNPDNHQYYRVLMRNIVILMIAISLIPLILLAAITEHYYADSLRKNVIAYLKVLVENHKIHIDTFLNEKLADIQLC